MSEGFEKVGILGSGGQADEAQSYFAQGDIVFRAVDPSFIENESLIDITNPTQEQQQTPVVAAVGAPAIRREMVEKWSGTTYASIVSEHSLVDKTTKVGEGCIIAPGAVLTTNIEVGNHVVINTNVTIGHDSKVGDYATISPGANIAGHVTIEDGVFIGIGAVVSNDISIAKGSVIGAGAVVIDNITDENAVYVGVPAKKIKQNEGWLREV